MSGDPPRFLRARDRVLPLGRKTYMMAILNLTSDSFSGDGVGADLDAAVRRAVQAQADGADIVDIGGESARADVPVRDAGDEAAQVAAAVERVLAETDLVVSADTYKGVVAEAAVQAGAHMINDIGGLLHDTATAEVAARYGAALVINYTLERPKVRPATPPQYDDLIAQHIAFLREQASLARTLGVADESLIIDPGIAFGKSHAEDIEVVRRLGEFQEVGLPVLVAASRKHFVGSATGLNASERDEATAAVTALAIAGGADFVRVHDVLGNARAGAMTDAIVRGRVDDLAPTSESWPWAATAERVPGTTISRG